MRRKLFRLTESVSVPLRTAVEKRFPRAGDFMALMRLDRPIGIYLLLWPCLWALFLAADGIPSLHLLAVFIGGVVLMRSAGCVINDFADRKLDPLVSRTRNRPLASGRVSSTEALLLFSLLCLPALLLVLTTNWLTISFVVPALAGTIIYPYMKRWTYVPQLVLGLVFSLGIPMAFAATLNRVPQVAWLLFTANMVWIVAYDTLYAMVDREDDLKAGIKSTAILFGDLDRLMVGVLQCLFLAAMLALGFNIRADIYFLFLGLAAVLLIYQQYLIRGRQPDACLKAFVNNSQVGAVIFVGILLDMAFRTGSWRMHLL